MRESVSLSYIMQMYSIHLMCVCLYVAVCCSVLQRVADKLDISDVRISVRCNVLQCFAVCCSVLQCVADVFDISKVFPYLMMRESVSLSYIMQMYSIHLMCVCLYVAVCCSVLQCVADKLDISDVPISVRCNVLQCFAVCCRCIRYN